MMYFAAGAQAASSNVRLSRKRSMERQKRATMRLEALLAAPENSMCADCSATSHLTWASINLGAFQIRPVF